PLRPRRGPGRRPGRRHDAAGPARTDDRRRLLPHRGGVLAPLRPDRRPRRRAAGPHDRHAPRPDEPRPGDRRCGRGLPAQRHRRPGRLRRLRPDGRPLPPARHRRPGGHPMSAVTTTAPNDAPAPLLIRGGRPYGEGVQDVLLADGRIRALGTDLELPEGTEIVEAEGCIVLPGLVDLHTHLREPGGEEAETVETGTRAAAPGGVVEQVARRGDSAGWCTVRPVGAVTVGLAGERLAELDAMANSRAQVRVFSDDGKCVHDPVLMRRALEYVKSFDGVIAQ